MLERAWEKLDKFYLVLAIVLTLMAILLIITFRGVFSAYQYAYEIDQNKVQADDKVDKDLLEEAYLWTMNKTNIPLQVRD
jgi:uncharacterized ion transporter superfamily protein YfcC